MAEKNEVTNLVPQNTFHNDDAVYRPNELLNMNKGVSNPAITKILIIHTQEVQTFVARYFENLNKALAEVYRNSKGVDTAKIKRRGDEKFKIINVDEERTRLRNDSLRLQKLLEESAEYAAGLLGDGIGGDESFDLTRPRRIQFLITTPEARLFTYLIETLDYIVRNYQLAWLNMSIDDKEKNDLISKDIGNLTQVTREIIKLSFPLVDARNAKTDSSARKAQRYAMKQRQANDTVDNKASTTEKTETPASVHAKSTTKEKPEKSRKAS